jgi:polyhydroxyalkanoate synthase
MANVMIDARPSPSADPVAPERVADAVESAEPVGRIGLTDGVRSLLGVARHGNSLGRRGARLGIEATKAMAGRSDVEPAKGDWRFKDETWQSNPGYRRIMQIYLAWSASMMAAVEEAELDWRNEFRARFWMEILTTAAAPTNTLLGNPAALKRAFETGGSSVVRGLRQLAGDAVHNRGMPTQVDRGAFEVGKDLAATPGAVVYRDEVCEVLQFAPAGARVHERPVLMVPPQINKYYFMDLAPGRSFVEHAVAHGLRFFVISWRNPSDEQADWDLDVYAEAVLRAIDVVRDISRSDDVNLLSLCAGGILTAGILSHLAAGSDTRVHTASFGVTLLDFDVPAPIGMFRIGPLVSLGRERSGRAGVLDGASLASVFNWLRPNDLVWNYWVNNYLLGKDPPRFDILAWNADATNLPARLHSTFLDIFQHNLLTKPGELRVLGTPVDLASVEVETYATGATTDHLTPWKGCYRTTQLMSGPSTFVLSNAGHIASLINPPGNPKAHYFAGPEPVEDPDAWLAQAQRRPGTWWEHWAGWVKERSGEERRAPERLGSRRHPVICEAPGQYVHG